MAIKTTKAADLANTAHLNEYENVRQEVQNAIKKYNDEFNDSLSTDVLMPHEILKKSIKKDWKKNELSVEKIKIGDKELKLLTLNNFKSIQKSGKKENYAETTLFNYIQKRDALFFKREKFSDFFELIKYFEEGMGNSDAYLRLLALEIAHYRNDLDLDIDIYFNQSDKYEYLHLDEVKNAASELSNPPKKSRALKKTHKEKGSEKAKESKNEKQALVDKETYDKLRKNAEDFMQTRGITHGTNLREFAKIIKSNEGLAELFGDKIKTLSLPLNLSNYEKIRALMKEMISKIKPKI